MSDLLPAPSATELQRSHALQRLIRQEIDDQGGYISFYRYMQLALYEPQFGYYSVGSEQIGKRGDFITAPHISAVYSRCIAKQCLQVLRHINGGDILELGPGTGIMAADILLELERCACLPKHYYMLEISEGLKHYQQEYLRQTVPQFAGFVRWVDQLPTSGFHGIILANEVLDAMPVQRLLIVEGELYECCVGWQQGKFVWCNVPANWIEEYQPLAGVLSSLPNVYITEINREIKPCLVELSKSLARGVVLIADYGYPRHEFLHPQRGDGTLICHYRHRIHGDPLLYPGLQDITASVDFTRVAEVGYEAGLQLAGFATQAHFLMACQLDEIIARETDVRARLQMSQQVKILILPGQMGEKFKFIALVKDMDIKLQGFGVADQRARL